MEIDGKYGALRGLIRGLGSAVVAFSGGVDSSFLCRVAHEVLGDGALAVTVVSPFLPERERAAAKELAAAVGIRHILVEEPQIEEIVAANPADRCYHCKKREFGVIARVAAENGMHAVLDGSNLDDLGDYRPGLAALGELGITSPLRLVGLGKAEIRELSRRLGLPTWDKPAFACLASRVPYGERITAEKLAMIEKAEDFLHDMGVRQVRVRAHGAIARIEVAPAERRLLFDEARMDRVAAHLKSLGFLYVCMELAGYATGSLNAEIAKTEGGAHG